MYRQKKAAEGWVTNKTREGSWIKIQFYQFIRISSIIYRHNERQRGKCCNQNFKDLSLHFSDGSNANMSVDDVFENGKNVDFLYRIDPPKISSHLLLMVNAVYDHYEPAKGFVQEIYAENHFGISNIRIIGKIEAGKITGKIYRFIYLCISNVTLIHI